MNNQELKTLLSKVLDTEGDSMNPRFNSPDGSDTQPVAEFILLALSGNSERLQIYANCPGIDKWSVLARFLLGYGELNEDCKDKEYLSFIVWQVIESVFWCGKDTLTNQVSDPPVNRAERFRPYTKELINLLDRLGAESLSYNARALDLLRSDSPLDTFCDVCYDHHAYGVYLGGAEWGYFPKNLPWENLIRAIDNVLAYGGKFLLDEGRYILPLVNTKRLSEEQIQYLLSKGCYALNKGIALPKRTKGIESGTIPYEDWLQVQAITTIEQAVNQWHDLSEWQKKAVEGLLHSEIKVGELPYVTTPLRIALLEAGIKELGLFKEVDWEE